MGRYYNGDIEGKFWFGVQSSNDADFFGATGYETYLSYYFTKEDHLEHIKGSLKICEDKLGVAKEELTTFFKNRHAYNEGQIKKETSLKTDKAIRDNLEWYARWELGKKILDCVEEHGECSFEAEQ